MVDSVADRAARGTGAIGGVMNFFNNLMGAVAPVVTGLDRRSDELIRDRISGGRNCSANRHFLLRRGARPDRTDPGAGGRSAALASAP